MRTTLQIDEDILHAAKSLAKAGHTTVGKVISDLARKGLAPRPDKDTHRGFPVFLVSSDIAPITSETVNQALDIGKPQRTVDPSSVFNLGRSQDADIAWGKYTMIGQAVAASRKRRPRN